jgi:hypothetical protein
MILVSKRKAPILGAGTLRHWATGQKKTGYCQRTSRKLFPARDLLDFRTAASPCFIRDAAGSGCRGRGIDASIMPKNIRWLSCDGVAIAIG